MAQMSKRLFCSSWYDGAFTVDQDNSLAFDMAPRVRDSFVSGMTFVGKWADFDFAGDDGIVGSRRDHKKAYFFSAFI